MSEGTYEYECMRAELLGIEKPDYDEFLKKKSESDQRNAEEEELDIENLKEAELQNEGLKNVSGGLEELNNILQVTQRKIHKFKASCGSLTNLLKIKIGGSTDSTTSEELPHTSSEQHNNEEDQNGPAESAVENGNQKKSDLTKALDNHVDKLDSMLEKAEKAQYSMQHQTKQMKKFLNK